MEGKTSDERWGTVPVRFLLLAMGLLVSPLELTGCTAGCPVEDQAFVRIENATGVDATVEFRFAGWGYDGSEPGVYNYYLETVAPNETKTVNLKLLHYVYYKKAGLPIKELCDTLRKSSFYGVSFSNTTLSQMTVCGKTQQNSSADDRRYKVQPLNTACDVDFQRIADGW